MEDGNLHLSLSDEEIEKLGKMYSIEELKDLLQIQIDYENFEGAAKIQNLIDNYKEE